MLSFDRMMQWSQEQGITLVFTGQGKQLEKQFTRENPSLVADGMLRFFADADHGMEWCENEIIAAYLPERQAQKDISEQLRAILSGGNVEKLLSYLQRREYRPGEYLIEEGDAADFIYFVESGQVTAQLESPGKPPVRLETITSGRTVGEIAFFLGTRRTASVVADLHSIVYSLCMDDLNRMEASDPEAAHLFNRLSVILLSQRVMHLTYTVRALERS
jgi:SulP family sulfate permease